MLTRRELGIGYLTGTGLGLIGGLLLYFTQSTDSLLVAIVGTCLGIFLAVSLPVSAWWLHVNGFPGQLIWIVAQWSAIGLGLTTLFVLPIILTRSLLTDLDFFPSLVANFIAAGAVLGVLFGTVSELSGKYERTRKLNQQNSVLNRVLRHDIRNDMSVIIAHTELLQEGAFDDEESALRTIRRKANEVIDLSETVRTVETLREAESREAVDLLEIVQDQVDQIKTGPADVSVEADLPSAESVLVDQRASSIIDNLVENAIEHNDQSPKVEIEVATIEESEDVEIVVADNGPGIPDEPVRLLEDDQEISLDDTVGLGLWLVRWLVDHCGGSIEVETGRVRGTAVCVRLPILSNTPSEARTGEPPVPPAALIL